MEREMRRDVERFCGHLICAHDELAKEYSDVLDYLTIETCREVDDALMRLDRAIEYIEEMVDELI